MKNTILNILVLLSLILFVGVIIININNKQNNAQIIKKIEWKKNENNISYYITCIEGYKWIATKSSNSHTQLAGPIGKCD